MSWPERLLGNFILPKARLNDRSSGNYFFADEMETNYLGRFAFVEMAASGITDTLPQLFQCLRFGKDGFAQSTGRKPAFVSFLY